MTSFQTFVVIGLAFVSMALAMPDPVPYPMPYPYALPDDPYAPAPAYHAPALGRVKIQVSFFIR